MPFQKGHKRSPDAGMKPGQKSLKVMAWERLGEYIINEGADRYLNHLRNLPDKDFIIEFKSVMEFFKPKLQRAEVKQETTVNDLRTFPKHIYIGYTDEEELRLRREDDKIPIEPNELPGKFHINYRDAEEETEIPGSVPMPKIHIKRDPD